VVVFSQEVFSEKGKSSVLVLGVWSSAGDSPAKVLGIPNWFQVAGGFNRSISPIPRLKSGELALTASGLGDANININYAYCGIEPGSGTPKSAGNAA
jgi:hypothetical protein